MYIQKNQFPLGGLATSTKRHFVVANCLHKTIDRIRGPRLLATEESVVRSELRDSSNAGVWGGLFVMVTPGATGSGKWSVIVVRCWSVFFERV